MNKRESLEGLMLEAGEEMSLLSRYNFLQGEQNKKGNMQKSIVQLLA